MLKEAREAKSPEELIALAKERGITMSEEEAARHFERFHGGGALSDDELDNVSGGGCGGGGSDKYNTNGFYEGDIVVMTDSRYPNCRKCGSPRWRITGFCLDTYSGSGVYAEMRCADCDGDGYSESVFYIAKV